MSRLRPSSGEQRNFVLGVLNGLLFTTAETLIDPTLVLVTFVSRLTDSAVLIGLVAPLRDAGWFLPQLWVSGRAQSQPYKLSLYRRSAVVRALAWGAMALVTLAAPAPGVMLAAFFLAFSTYSLAAGFGGLAFMEVVGKTIPPNRRAVFFAWRLFTGGLAGLGAAAVVRVLAQDTDLLPFPLNFGVLFAVGWGVALAGLVAFSLIDEPPDTTLQPRASALAQLRRAWEIVHRDPLYRRFIYLRLSLIVAGAAVPFFAVYVQGQLGGAPEMIGPYLAVYTVASLLANVFFGRFAGWLGTQGMMTLASLAGLLMVGVVLALLIVARVYGVSGQVASLWLLPAFGLFGIRESGLGVAGQPLLLEIAPTEERSLYLGFTNTLLGLGLLSTALSGVVVAALGFPVLLALSLLMHLVALWADGRMRATGSRGRLAPASARLE